MSDFKESFLSDKIDQIKLLLFSIANARDLCTAYHLSVLLYAIN